MTHAVRSYRLRWEIFNPFLPLRRLVASFHHRTSQLTHWQVILDPLNRETNRCDFSFSLRRVRFDESESNFPAERVEVDISLNGIRVDDRDEPSYIFRGRNLNSYGFQTFFNFLPSKEPHHLVVNVMLSFQDRNAVIGGQPGFYFIPADLETLSWDMMQLLNYHFLSDMILLSNNQPDVPLEVHYWVIDARWNNFFRVHNLNRVPDDPVQTYMSYDLLCYILIYMYSGAINRWSADMDEAFTTELFQVINRFDLNHLHTNFFSRDSGEEQSSRMDMIVHVYNFPRASGREFNSLTFHRLAGEVSFQIRFFLNAGVPSFEYSLLMVSGSRRYAQVNLELITETRIPGRPRRSTRVPRTEHERDYTMRLGVLERSGTCHFEGDQELVNAFVRGDWRGRRREIKYSIRCTLNLSDGSSIRVIRSIDNNLFPDNLERLEVLSDHLEAAKRNPIEADLNVVCRDRTLNTALHRSMLAARLPIYRNNPEAIPLEITCNLSHQSFAFVLNYMYTGKSFLTPLVFLQDIDHYAAAWRFVSLLNFVNRMRQVIRELFA